MTRALDRYRQLVREGMDAEAEAFCVEALAAGRDHAVFSAAYYARKALDGPRDWHEGHELRIDGARYEDDIAVEIARREA